MIPLMRYSKNVKLMIRKNNFAFQQGFFILYHLGLHIKIDKGNAYVTAVNDAKGLLILAKTSASFKEL